MSNSSINAYSVPLSRVLKLVSASIGFTLVAVSLAWTLKRMFGRHTVFDEAVNILLGYQDKGAGFIAFLAAVMLMIVLTLILEPAQIAIWLRRHVFLPALHVVEHMLSLVIGVFVALICIEAVRSDLPDDLWIKAFSVAFTLGALLLLALFAAVTGHFLEHDYEKMQKRLGASQYLIPAAFGLILGILLFWDFIWTYGIKHGHATG